MLAMAERDFLCRLAGAASGCHERGVGDGRYALAACTARLVFAMGRRACMAAYAHGETRNTDTGILAHRIRHWSAMRC